jgi:hypothetical protein
MIEVAQVCVCDRCEHRWLAEVMPPKRCAKCKTPNWNADEGMRAVRPNVEGMQAESVEWQEARVKREGQLAMNISPLRSVKLCEHGAVPRMCKFSKCRGT